MKLIVKKLWYPHDVEDTVNSLFKIRQMQELFDEEWEYGGEISIRGLTECPFYWSADKILKKLPTFEKDIVLVLTGIDLLGDYGRINGKGYDRKAIASNDAYISGINKDIFDPADVSFNAMAFSEVSHAFTLSHHKSNYSNPCVMSHNENPSADWKSLDEVRLCDSCYEKILKQ